MPLFSYGFRPFFLFGALHAAVMVALWVPWFLGFLAVPSALPPVAWHGHELLFGYVPAIAAGFLLTAIPNWTGRLPVAGWPLVGLWCLWLLGRAVVAMSLFLPEPAVVVGSLSFLATFLCLSTREVVRGRNWRNLKVIVVVLLLVSAQALFHFEVHSWGRPVYADRLAIAATLTLIMIVGGRIVPSFTINWLKRENPGPLPAPFGGFDRLAMSVGVVALAGWIVGPVLPSAQVGLAGLLLLAGILHTARLARWRGGRTLAEPLVTVLHVGYGFVPLGFILAGVAVAGDHAGMATAALHAWTAGAIGLMTLAVMTRATLGHSGRALTATRGTVLLYVLAGLAAIARVVAALWPDVMSAALSLAAGAWVAAFLVFALVYGPMLCQRRPVRP